MFDELMDADALNQAEGIQRLKIISNLFKEGPVLVIAWENKNRWPVEYISENAVQIIGYTAEECMKSDFSYADLIHPEDYTHLVEEVEKHLSQSSKYFEQIYRLKTKSGKYIWIRDYSAPLYEQGVVNSIRGYIFDITKEREVESQLLEQSNRYIDIVEATQAGIWEWNLLTDKLIVNQRYAEILGYSLQEMNDLDIEKWKMNTHRGDAQKVVDLLHEHIEGHNEYYEAEFRMRHKDGHWVWLSDRGKVIKWTKDNKPLIMVGSHIDITESKKTELMLHHSEKVSAIGRLAGGIAHDINNQLMMIQGYIDILKAKDLLLNGLEQLQNIEDIVTRSTEIVKQLQSFTKQTTIKRDDVEVNSLVQRIGKMMFHAIEKRISIQVLTSTDIQKEIEVEQLNTRREGDNFPIEQYEELHISGDVSLIENALVNLCLNARDSIIDMGDITISVKKVEVEKPMQTYTNLLDGGTYVCISIKDNGIGISEKVLSQIFEPFFTTKEKGTGLGLSTVISAIKQYNGGITVESRLGRGTIFSLYFPLIQEDSISHTEEPEHIKSPIENTLCIKKIMIVDDELVLCQVLSQYLESKGLSTISFTDPRDAFDYYEAYYDQVECVILDVIMPYMSGNELFEKLIGINNNIRALYLSGYTEGLSIPDNHNKNIIGLLEKPVKFDIIFDLLTSSINAQNH